VTGQPKVTDAAKLLWRAARLIEETAAGLESADAPSDVEREWLADYRRIVEQGKARRRR
jgi:hypothetical protein